jgi:hypothetical protein
MAMEEVDSVEFERTNQIDGQEEVRIRWDSTLTGISRKSSNDLRSRNS